MKHLKFIVFLVTIFISCHAQEQKLLISTDFSFPSIDELEGYTYDDMKEQFLYLDSIEVGKITYLSDGLKVNGYLIKPKKAGKYPCIIYNRGGNREFGALNYKTAVWLGRLATKGYIIIASQYRGNGGSEGQEEFGGDDVNDVLILTDVLKEIKEADTNRIGMYGWSRGGMMTYIALTKTNQIKTAVVGGGLADMYTSAKDRPGLEENVHAELIPDFENKKNDAYKKRSAVKWANKFSKNVPILILHGNSDWRVKASQSLRLAIELEKYRIPHRLIIYEGGDHGLTEHIVEVEEQTIHWFNKYLKRQESLPNMEYHGR